VTITEIKEWELPIKGILIFSIGVGIVYIGCEFKNTMFLFKKMQSYSFQEMMPMIVIIPAVIILIFSMYIIEKYG
jgi:hypothetical protein